MDMIRIRILYDHSRKGSILGWQKTCAAGYAGQLDNNVVFEDVFYNATEQNRGLWRLSLRTPISGTVLPDLQPGYA